MRTAAFDTFDTSEGVRGQARGREGGVRLSSGPAARHAVNHSHIHYSPGPLSTAAAAAHNSLSTHPPPSLPLPLNNSVCPNSSPPDDLSDAAPLPISPALLLLLLRTTASAPDPIPHPPRRRSCSASPSSCHPLPVTC
jgi:hypothetical protein